MKVKSALIFLIILLLSTSVEFFAQVDSTNIKYGDNSITDTLSTIPTIDEINRLFSLTTQGKRDPFKILSLVSSRKRHAVPALEEFLFPKIKQDTSKNSKLNKAYGVLVLGIIATKAALKLLLRTALTYPDSVVRGTAVRTLAWNCYYRALNDSSKPDKEILHTLFNSADDTTYVPDLHNTIGGLARQGIENWSEMNFGDLPKEEDGKYKKIKVKSLRVGSEIAIQQYREEWWQDNKDKLSWDKSNNKFKVKEKK